MSERKKLADKILEGMEAPGRFLSDKAAEAVGAEKGKTSEDTYFNVVDKAAEKLGVPEDSTIGNMGKAAAVAGLSYFADPSPTGKIKRSAKVVKRIVDNLPKKETAAQVYKAAKQSGKGVAVVETAQEAAEKRAKEKMMKVIDARKGKEL